VKSIQFMALILILIKAQKPNAISLKKHKPNLPPTGRKPHPFQPLQDN
jgi:hypothetical protein